MTMREMLQEKIDNWARLGHPALLDRFVLRNGKAFTPGKRIGRKGKAKNCYGNATKVVLRDPDATYVEGFVVNKELPIEIHHAWVTYDGKTVMDPTLDAENYEYFGVEFDTSTLRKEMIRNKVYGILDPGLGFNTDLMFRIDPELEEIVKTVRPDPKLRELMERQNEEIRKS
jgi:hypothetical protein